MRSLGRRAFLEWAALLTPVGFFRPLAAPRRAAAPAGLDAFVALSERLTGRVGLDRGLAQTYLTPILADPASAELLGDLAAGRDAVARTPAHVALEERILVAWYTGVHDTGRGRERATQAGALMWSALSRPALGLCTGAPSSWSEPPSPRR